MLRKGSGGGRGLPGLQALGCTVAIPGHAASFTSCPNRAAGSAMGVEPAHRAGFRKGWEDSWSKGDALKTPARVSVRAGGLFRA